MGKGIKGPDGGPAAPPYSLGPYTWDQRLSFGGSSASTAVSDSANGTRLFASYLNSSATGGDQRAIYNRLWLSGIGSSGESLRSFCTINAVAANTAHGAHLSLNFVSVAGSGSLSGLGVASRATLHIPDDASFTSGTLAAVQAEIWADGAASDTDGVTEVSFIRVVAGGTQAGIDDIEEDAFLLSIQGFTAATGSLVELGTGMGTVTGTLKIKVGSDIRFLPFYSSAG